MPEEATRIISTRLKLDGEDQYTAQLKNIGANLKTLGSEMALVTAKFEGQLNSYDALAAKGKVLADQLKEQEAKQITLKEAYEKAVSTHEAFINALADENTAYEKIKGTEADTVAAKAEHKKKIEELETGYAKSANTVNYYQKEVNYAEAAVVKANKAIEQNDKYLGEADKSANKCATSIDEFGKTVKQAAAETEKAAEETNKAAESMDDFGSKGAAGIDALASALVAAGVAKGVKEIADVLRDCVGAAVEFEAAMAGVRRTVGGTDEDIQAFSDQIREMATTIPMSTASLAKIAETAGQLGIASSDVMSFTEVMAKLGTATDITAENAATMLAQFANVTGLDPQDYDRMGAVVAALGDSTATTASKVVDMSQRMAGAASIAGFSQTDIMALAAAVGSLGIESQAGGTAMATLISKLQLAVETGKGLDEFANAAGMSARQFSEMWKNNAVGALDAFTKGLNDTERTGKSAIAMLDEMGISNVRQRQAILGLAQSGDLLTSTIAQGNQAWAENTALSEKASIMYDTTAAKQELLKNSVDNLKVSIGEQLAPALNNLIDAGTGVAQWAADFIERNEWLVPIITALGVALGILAVALAGYTIATKLAEAATNAFTAALASNPIGAVIVAIVALTAAVAAFVAIASDGSGAAGELAKETKEAEKSFKASADTYKESSGAIEAQNAVTERYIARLKELEKVESLSADEKREYAAIVRQLNSLYPEFNGQIDENTGKLTDGLSTLEDLTKAWYENARAQAAQQVIAEQAATLVQEEINLKKAQEELDNMQQQRADMAEPYYALAEALGYSREVADEFSVSLYDMRELAAGYTTPEMYALCDATNDVWMAFDDLTFNANRLEKEIGKDTATFEEHKQELEKTQDAVNEVIAGYMDYTEKTEAAAKATELFAASQVTTVASTEELSKSFKGLLSNINLLNNAFEEQAKNGELSINTIMSLVDAGYAAALSIDAETGAVTLNQDAYYRLIKVKLEEQRASAQAALRDAQIRAMNAETEAAYALANGLARVAIEQTKVASLANAEVAGIEASLAAMDQAMANLSKSSSLPIGGGGSGGGGGGSKAKEKTQAELDLEAYKKAYADISELRKNDELTAMEYYAKLGALSDQFLRDPENVEERKKAAQELRTIYEQESASAIEAVKSGYVSMEEAAQIFGVNLTDITERYSIEKLYGDQMAKAVDAVRDGSMSVFDAMKQFGVEYNDLTAALDGYNDAMKKMYDEQRDLLDYYHKMGKVSNEEYYDELTRLRDEYLEENTAAWRMANIELYNLQKDANDQLAKLQEEAYNQMLSAINKNLADTKSALADMLKAQKEQINEELAAKKAALNDMLKARKDQIAAELAAEKARINAIIDGINAEIKARRELRADEGSEEKIRLAEEAVSDAKRELAAAQSQVDYARDDAAKAEAEKLVIQKEKALADAQNSLLKAQQDYEDQLWYREKNAEIEEVKAGLAVADEKAKTAKDDAEAEIKGKISDAEAQAKAKLAAAEIQIQQQIAIAEEQAKEAAIKAAQEKADQESQAMLDAYIKSVTQAAQQAADVAANAAAGAVTNAVTKNANVNVTYNNTAATSSQISAAVQKALDKL